MLEHPRVQKEIAISHSIQLLFKRRRRATKTLPGLIRVQADMAARKNHSHCITNAHWLQTCLLLLHGIHKSASVCNVTMFPLHSLSSRVQLPAPFCSSSDQARCFVWTQREGKIEDLYRCSMDFVRVCRMLLAKF